MQKELAEQVNNHIRRSKQIKEAKIIYEARQHYCCIVLDKIGMEIMVLDNDMDLLMRISHVNWN